jgi:hypothetical protein
MTHQVCRQSTKYWVHVWRTSGARGAADRGTGLNGLLCHLDTKEIPALGSCCVRRTARRPRRRRRVGRRVRTRMTGHV